MLLTSHYLTELFYSLRLLILSPIFYSAKKSLAAPFRFTGVSSVDDLESSQNITIRQAAIGQLLPVAAGRFMAMNVAK